MAIQCPSCQTRLSVSAKHQGRRIRCPVCKTIIEPPIVAQEEGAPLPEPPVAIEASEPNEAITEFEPVSSVLADASDLEEEPDEIESRPTRRAKSRKPAKQKKNRWLLVVGSTCALGLFLIGLILAATFYLQLSGKIVTPSAQQEHRVESLPLPPPPRPNLEEIPIGPAPPQMDADSRRKVIRATAYIKTTRIGNVVQQGSGFFAAEPGLVFTNAHVVGMGAAGCAPPAQVDVVVNSGEPDEHILNGQVLAADWVVDLAVLRVGGPAEHWPSPLTIHSSHILSELQKVYIFGFPFGSSLGKNITASESSVSSLRKDASGNISQVQVNGGMQPGNSGGPVVDSRGLVVGVAVSMIGGTQINFAVPAEKLHGLLRGQVDDVQFGEPYLDMVETRLPLVLKCVDPLHRLRALNVEVWAGGADAPRPMSFTKPEALPGDGPREVFPLTVKDGKAGIEVALPALKDGQVLWVQPVVTDVGNTVRWAAARYYQPSGLTPLVRAPATLQLQFDTQAERTLKMTCTDRSRVTMGSDELIAKKTVEAEALELARKDGKGGEFQCHFGPYKASNEANGKKLPADPQIETALRGRLIRYNTNAEGALQKRGTPTVDAAFSVQTRREFDDLVNQLANAYELTCLPMPNRVVQPRETWQAQLPLMTVADGQQGTLNLRVTCTFEGRRVVQDQNQAVITVAGAIYGGFPLRSLGGTVTGRVCLSLDKGYVSQADFKVEHEYGRGNVFTSRIIEVSLSRAPGNTLGIVPTKPFEVKTAKPLLQVTTSFAGVNTTDLAGKPGPLVRSFPVKLVAGQAYLIEAIKAGESELVPLLVLKVPDGTQVANAEDGGGAQNARIRYTPAKSGMYHVCATSRDPKQVGAFRLVVTEEASDADDSK